MLWFVANIVVYDAYEIMCSSFRIKIAVACLKQILSMRKKIILLALKGLISLTITDSLGLYGLLYTNSLSLWTGVFFVKKQSD